MKGSWQVLIRGEVEIIFEIGKALLNHQTIINLRLTKSFWSNLYTIQLFYFWVFFVYWLSNKLISFLKVKWSIMVPQKCNWVYYSCFVNINLCLEALILVRCIISPSNSAHLTSHVSAATLALIIENEMRSMSSELLCLPVHLVVFCCQEQQFCPESSLWLWVEVVRGLPLMDDGQALQVQLLSHALHEYFLPLCLIGTVKPLIYETLTEW